MSDSDKLREHADKIKAAFEAAEKDGFVLSFEHDFDLYEPDQLDSLSLDLNEYAEFEFNGKTQTKIIDWVVLREESY